MWAAPQQFLRHQIDRVVALRRHHLWQGGFIFAAARNLKKIPALRRCDPELNAAGMYRDLADRTTFALTKFDVDLAIICINKSTAPVPRRLIELPIQLRGQPAQQKERG